MKWLRYGVLAVFIIAMIVGLNALAILIAPYSAYGRMVSALFAPVWQWETTFWHTLPNGPAVMLFMKWTYG